MNNLIKQINTIISEKPKVCIILGSGLDTLIASIQNKKILPYNNIKGFYNTSVKGHLGQFVFGYINQTPILCARGRFHYYEGFTFDEVGIIIKIFNYFNPQKYIITNSSGCLHLNWGIGEFMLVNQFLDFSFTDSQEAIKYKLHMENINNLNIHIGTYAYTIGPTYETKSEIEEIISLGGDVVGMSTFPEYLMCKKLNIHPIIISCLTNYGAGLINRKIKHTDVVNNANAVKENFESLIKKII